MFLLQMFTEKWEQISEIATKYQMYSYITSLSICESQNKIVPSQLILANHIWGFDPQSNLSHISD